MISMSARTPFIVFVGWSIAFHVGLLTLAPRPVVRPTPPQRTIEVSYQGSVGILEAPVPPQDVAPPSARPPKENPLEKNALAITEFIKKDILKVVDRQPKERPFADRERVNKSVSMPSIPGETLKTPEYRSYYQLVREKIRKYAYFYYRKLEEGEVYLSFSLKPEGTLTNLAVNEGQSTASAYLKDIARQSINEAAPYPPFPQKLRENAELSFDVIIEFKLK